MHVDEALNIPLHIFKGVSNSFSCAKKNIFNNHSHNFAVNDLMATNFHTFSHQWSSSIHHSYKYRLYSQMASLSQLLNSKLNCRRQYESPRFVESMPFLLES